MPSGRIESVNTSRGGVPKTSVFEAGITTSGLEGDRQSDLRHHGGPDRAVMLFSLEVIRALQAEGHPIDIGTVGENLTISGLDWTMVSPGRELQAGTVRVLVTEYAAPCENISGSFLAGDFVRIAQKVHPGSSRVYARVLAEGVVRPGQPIELVS